MGFSFKEDCPDLRNTRIIDIVDELKEHNIKVDVYDPWVDKDAALKEYNIKLLKNLPSTLVAGAIIRKIMISMMQLLLRLRMDNSKQ